MIIEIKIPSPGESISEVEIGSWLVEDGAIVEKGEEIAEVESEKATLTLIAGESGELHVIAKEGETIPVGSVACTINTDKAISPAKPKESIKKEESPKQKITPVAKSVMKAEGLSIDEVMKGAKRITRKDVEKVVSSYKPEDKEKPGRKEERRKMSSFRKKLGDRLVAAKNKTAMLTTFNEADMSKLIKLRTKYQQQFIEKHGFKVGFMSFFTKAVSIALEIHPSINSMIDGDEIIVPHYYDISIAVQTPKGLMVPVIRSAETKSIPELESNIKELAEKARNKQLTIDEMSGGTFTITNGGVFGSLLSTPIINPPQSSILGMHTIQERPVAINGEVVIRPMMYLALSYDHRLIDGKDSVAFLLKVKELIENPEQMLFEGKTPEEVLLRL
jgi:2-oxoglutarate dehydrogenase E2 component (dihydrolipoamide succinyltransferase)